MVNDWNLNDEDLAPYRLLILPNTACLNRDQALAITKFVERGGGLVASVDASLSNETGTPHRNFSLASLFGVDYQGIPAQQEGQREQLDANFLKGVGSDYWEKRKSVYDLRPVPHPIFDHPKIREYLGDASVTFKGQAVAVKPRAGARVIATMTPRNQSKPEYPAMVVHQYGKGRTVYLAAGLDSAYYLYAYPYQRIMLAQALRWAAQTAPPIAVTAPMCVHSSFFRQQKDGKRLIVHLYNDVNTTGGHAFPQDDAPLREETLPIHDIQVRFNGYKISRVHLEPEGFELPVHREGDQIEVTVPKLEIHSMVVAELE